MVHQCLSISPALQPVITQKVFFHLFGENLNIKHIRCFGDVFDGAVFLQDIDGVIFGAVGVGRDGFLANKISGFVFADTEMLLIILQELLLERFSPILIGQNFHFEEFSVGEIVTEC